MTTQTFTEVAERHAAQDMLRRGTYGGMNGDFHGCSVGCFLYDYDPSVATDHANVHARLAKHTGIAEWALHVQDHLFENLPDPAEWHVECAKAYDKFAGDWDKAEHRFMARVQREVVANPTEHNERVAALHERAAAGDMPSGVEWSAARSAAWSAAESAANAAWSAAKSAAASAAESAAASAESAANAAWSAAWSAAKSAAESAARSAAATAVKGIFLAVLAEPETLT